jgi:hypothetical protein
MHAVTVRSKMRREPIGAPALPYPCQQGMIGQSFLQAVHGEPADRQIDLRLAHEPPVVDHAEQEARQHQPDRRLRRYPWTPDARRVECPNLGWKPGQIQHPIDARKDMFVRDESTQRTADKELELPPLLLPQHSNPCLNHFPSHVNQEPATFSTAPRHSAATGRPADTLRCSRRDRDRRPR